MRTLADTYKNTEAARVRCRLADEYDKLADRAEQRAMSDIRRLPTRKPA